MESVSVLLMETWALAWEITSDKATMNNSCLIIKLFFLNCWIKNELLLFVTLSFSGIVGLSF